MNFVHLKNYSVFLPLTALFIVIHPGTIISEPRYKTEVAIPPITILYSGITKLDTSDALLLRINSEDPSEVVSTCSDERIVIEAAK